jgi:hypothetical protein
MSLCSDEGVLVKAHSAPSSLGQRRINLRVNQRGHYLEGSYAVY